MKILTIIGARPQFIKAAALSETLRARGHEEWLVHTGQHYDANMSDVFFTELGIPAPNVNLHVGSGSHGAATAAMLEGIEKECLTQKPDWLLVYGDTNSTLAGALAAAKLHIPVAHVEAGLRSFNKAMPEEVNRVLTDHISNLLFCPTQHSADNLAKEGIRDGVHVVGDIMHDCLLRALPRAEALASLPAELGLKNGEYHLATIHRASNTDDPVILRGLLEALHEIGNVVFPMHPRCRARIDSAGLTSLLSDGRIKSLEPVGYLHMLQLAKNARAILTDSGGLQKEAYWLNVPCVTLREETEWVETAQSGWNQIVGVDREAILKATSNLTRPESHPDYYGTGDAATKICDAL